MSKLLKFEFRKLSQQKSLYVCTAILLFIDCLSIILEQLWGETMNLSRSFPSAWCVAENGVSSMFTLLASIYISIAVCEDTSSGTIKNICSKGYDRLHVCISKYVATLVGSLVMMLVSFVFMLLYGACTDRPITEFPQDYWLGFLAQLLTLMAFHGLYFVFSIMVGKTGGAIAFNVVIQSLISLPCLIADYALSYFNIDFSISEYVLESLLANAQSVMSGCYMGLDKVFVTSCIYIVIFALASIYLNSKKQY